MPGIGQDVGGGLQGCSHIARAAQDADGAAAFLQEAARSHALVQAQNGEPQLLHVHTGLVSELRVLSLQIQDPGAESWSGVGHNTLEGAQKHPEMGSTRAAPAPAHAHRACEEWTLYSGS